MYGRFGIHNDFLHHAFVDKEGFKKHAEMFNIKNVINFGTDIDLISYSQRFTKEEIELKQFLKVVGTSNNKIKLGFLKG